MPRHPHLRRVVLVVVLAAGTSGCMTGPRPTLEAPRTVSDTASQTVLDRLGRDPGVDFTAQYTITPSSAAQPTQATVSRRNGVVRTEIGSVVYTTDSAGASTTCDTAGGSCENAANDARISDLGITHLFWRESTRQRLTNDAGRRIGSSTGTTATIAGQAAVCVAIKIPSSLSAPSDVGSVGTVTYCALDQGLLGRYIGADATIELTSFSIAPPSITP